MESIDLAPKYSTNEVSGRCVKWLAEEKLFSCMRELFKDEKDPLKASAEVSDFAVFSGIS